MLNETLNQFPITSHLEEICSTLKNSESRFLVLTAETAAGKSTILPLGLMEAFEGKILMTEPRRLAVLGVASRVAELKEEQCGQSVGYRIHLENKISEQTRLEVETEAILVRQLQNDPALENYNLVVLDEFHERSINLDLALAFLKEAMELRDDLYVIIMSATIDTKKLQSYLGNGNADSVPVMKIPGRQFPVEVEYADKMSVEGAVETALKDKEYTGNILVFLPGISDIRKAESNLKDVLNDEIELCILHSSISLEQQRKVIKPGQKRRVILSSAIAETSLTVPGVTTVIDSGLSRVNRLNIATGMENLCTETESEFSAEQRKGRAGRVQKGKCICLWSKFDPRLKELSPEILRTDLTNLVLECADRGIYSPDKIDWLDKPVTASWNSCVQLLQELEMITSEGRITNKGKTALVLGVHPRLGAVALAAYSGTAFYPEAKRLLIKFGSYAKSAPDVQKKYIDDLEHRLKILKPDYSINTSDSRILLLYGYPDRLAKRVTEQGKLPAEYQFPSGRKAILNECKTPEWIIAPEVLAGNSIGTVFEYVEINEADINVFLKEHSKTVQVCTFNEGKINKTENLMYGQIILASKKMEVEAGDFANAWVHEVVTAGIDCLPLDDKINRFLMRVEFYKQQTGQNNFEGDESLKEYLSKKAEEWLVPFIGNAVKITSQMIYDGLYWFLDGALIDKEVPEIFLLPNGRKVKVIYEKQSDIRPIIEIIIQRIFGCFETPVICGKKVLLRLLSPASRPLQVTEDLENFWTGAWIEICKEMKGRYPKHNWDYKVVEKE